MWWLVAIIAIVSGAVLSAVHRDKVWSKEFFEVGCLLAFLIGLGYYLLMSWGLR